MIGAGSGISLVPHGGDATVNRPRPVARKAAVVDIRQRSSEAYKEILGRHIVTMEPESAYGTGVKSLTESVSRIGELMVYLEQKYKLTEE